MKLYMNWAQTPFLQVYIQGNRGTMISPKELEHLSIIVEYTIRAIALTVMMFGMNIYEASGGG